MTSLALFGLGPTRAAPGAADPRRGPAALPVVSAEGPVRTGRWSLARAPVTGSAGRSREGPGTRGRGSCLRAAQPWSARRGAGPLVSTQRSGRQGRPGEIGATPRPATCARSESTSGEEQACREAWITRPGARRAVSGRSVFGLMPSACGFRNSGTETGMPPRTWPPPASGSKRPTATRPRRTPPPYERWSPARTRSAGRPRRTSVLPACTGGQAEKGPATCASTSGKQHSTGLPPPRPGSEPNMPSRFSPSLDRRGLLLSPLSQATAWPPSSIGVVGSDCRARCPISHPGAELICAQGGLAGRAARGCRGMGRRVTVRWQLPMPGQGTRRA